MVVFGLQSSFFDVITFLLLLLYFHATATIFQTGWFIESVITEILILLVIRTRRPLPKSVPGKYLLVISIAVAVVSCILPFTPLSDVFEFQPISAGVVMTLLGVTFVYMISAEWSKARLLKKYDNKESCSRLRLYVYGQLP